LSEKSPLSWVIHFSTLSLHCRTWSDHQSQKILRPGQNGWPIAASWQHFGDDWIIWVEIWELRKPWTTGFNCRRGRRERNMRKNGSQTVKNRISYWSRIKVRGGRVRIRGVRRVVRRRIRRRTGASDRLQIRSRVQLISENDVCEFWLYSIWLYS
jgi:hypothetical protein